jgi:hypothetical protein
LTTSINNFENFIVHNFEAVSSLASRKLLPNFFSQVMFFAVVTGREIRSTVIVLVALV